MKRIFGFCLCCTLIACMSSCGSKSSSPAPDSNAATTESSDTAAKDNKDAKNSDDAGSLKPGKWPAAIYSKYGIDEITTKGKIVFTDLVAEGPYQYTVDYHGVSQTELQSWVNALIAKGMRIHDRDKERVENSKYNHDVMIYSKDEKQAYRMRISFDFEKDMEFEYYDENPNPAFTVTEKGEGDDAQNYIVYNLSISLNPLKTEQEFKGSFDSLGLKAEDLKINEHVRSVSMSEGPNGGTMRISFYQDHFTTKEEIEACRNFLTDKLAEKGATFKHAMSGKDMTADELKQAGIGSYSIENNGKKFMMMVDSDTEFNEFGSGYGVRLMIKK